MHRAFTAVSLVLLSILPLRGASQTPLSPSSRFAQARGRQIVTPDGRALRTKGINLGNWLVPEGYMWHLEHGAESPRHIEQLVASLIGPDDTRRFWQRWRDTYVTRDDLVLLKRIGFDTVRIPFQYRLFMSDEDEHVWRDEGFAPLDRAVRWAREIGLYVVLDLHGAPGGQTGANIDDSVGTPWLFESQASADRMVTLWQRVAARYKDEPAVLAYELLNEPIAPYLDWTKYNGRLEPLYRRTVEAIRAVDPFHIIMLGGAQWNTNFDVFGRPFAPNLVYTFHKYWSETTEASIQPYLDFRDRYDVPIWLGETGENNDQWIKAAAELFESHDIGWAYWPYKKMDATSSVVSFERPAGWDAVVKYAQVSPYDYEAGRKARPSPDDARRMLQQLLENVQVARCRVNAGYVQALGLTVPQSSSQP